MSSPEVLESARIALEEGHLAGLVGASTEGRRLLRTVLRVAHASGAVLIRGPAGAGKMAVARALHQLAGRGGPMAIADDAQALEGGLHAASLVVRDVQTWSESDQRALVHHLDRGLGARVFVLTREPRPSPSLQPALLHRLSLNLIEVPALSTRSADIELIAEHHLARLPADADGQPWRLTTAAVIALRTRIWNGNVRELVQMLERATHRAQLSPLRTHHLGIAAPHASLDLNLTLAEVERRHVEAVLAAREGNVTEAGRALGVPRSTLYRRLRAWEEEGTRPVQGA